MTTRADRNRVHVRVTLDPRLAEAVDAYVAAHVGVDRSAIINEALRLWYAQQQEEAISAQHAADAECPPADEWASWKAVQREASRRSIDPEGA